MEQQRNLTLGRLLVYKLSDQRIWDKWTWARWKLALKKPKQQDSCRRLVIAHFENDKMTEILIILIRFVRWKNNYIQTLVISLTWFRTLIKWKFWLSANLPSFSCGCIWRVSLLIARKRADKKYIFELQK